MKDHAITLAETAVVSLQNLEFFNHNISGLKQQPGLLMGCCCVRLRPFPRIQPAIGSTVSWRIKASETASGRMSKTNIVVFIVSIINVKSIIYSMPAYRKILRQRYIAITSFTEPGATLSCEKRLLQLKSCRRLK